MVEFTRCLGVIGFLRGAAMFLWGERWREAAARVTLRVTFYRSMALGRV